MNSSSAAPSAAATAPAYLAAPHARVGSIIPREVVSWLQSLQLSRPVQVPRRDLANGFSVAEICSRYWPTLVSMHSYENRLSTQNKASNWGLLQKIFAKQGAPLSDKVIDGMMNGKEHYADVFLTQLYGLLTGKTVRLTALPLDDLPEPVEKVDPFEPTSVALAAANTTESLGGTYSYPTDALGGSLGQSGTGAARAAAQPSKSAAAALDELGTSAAPAKSGAGGLASRPVAGAAALIDTRVLTDRESGEGASGRPPQSRAAAAVATTQRTSRPIEQTAGAGSLRTQRKSSVGSTLQGTAGSDAAGGHFLVDVHVRAATTSTTVVDTASAHPRVVPTGNHVTTTTTTTTTTAAEQKGIASLGSGRRSGQHRGSLVSGGAASAVSTTSGRPGSSAPLSAASPTSAAATAGSALVSAIPNTAATQLVEHTVRQAADRLHCAWDVVLRGACPFAVYFLQNESDMDAAVRSGVWSALLTALQELVQLVRADSTLMPSLTMLFLCLAACAEGSSSKGSTADTGASTSVPRSVTFLAAVLAQLASLDPFHALASFQSGVLAVPAVHGWLSHVQYAEADQFAVLVCATASPDRATAALLLPDLLSAVYETVADKSGAAEAPVVFGMILRAVATRLVRPATVHRSQQTVTPPVQGGLGAAATSSPGTASGRPATGGAATTASPRLEREDPLNTALLHVLDFNTVAALASSAASVRLIGYALATTAVRLGTPLRTVLTTHARLLFPALVAPAQPPSWQLLFPLTDAPALHVLRAQWLRAVQERVAAAEDEGAGATIVTTTNTAADGAAGHASVKGMLSLLFNALCSFVSAPGGHVKAKALAAYELACSLVVLPASFTGGGSSSEGAVGADVRDAVADTVVGFFATRAPADILEAAVGMDVTLLLPNGETAAAGAGASVPSPSSVATAGVVVGTGLVWQHALLGPLRIHQLCARSAPLFLSAAVSRLASESSTLTESKKEAIRRLSARASILAKEGNVAAATRLRVEWLYFVTVGYGGESTNAQRALPVTARQLTSSAVSQRWEAVLQDAYVDLLLLLSAEELIMRQQQQQQGSGAGSASAAAASRRPLSAGQEAVLGLASHVKRMLRRWYTDLAPLLGGEKVDQEEPDAKAITWFHQMFGDAEQS